MEFGFESSYLNVLLLLLIALATLYWYSTSTFRYWKDKGLAFVKPVPFFGNLRDLVFARTSFPELFLKLYEELEGHDCGGVFQFRNPLLLIRSPELIKQVLVKDFVHFHDRDILDHADYDPLTAHLFNLSGSRWKNLRTKLTPTFTSGKMKAMFHLVNNCGLELQKYLEEKANNQVDVEFKEILAKFSTDVIGSCAFGVECNSLKNPDSEFRNMGRRIISPTFVANLNRVCLIFLPGLAKILKLRFVESDITSFFINVVKETVDHREKNDVNRHDFMDLLIQIKNKGAIKDDNESIEETQNTELPAHDEKKGSEKDEPLTLTQMAAQAFVFFFAGFETSSTTMSFCLYELALNPDIQDKLRAEIKSGLDKCGGQLTYESLHQMDYLDKVVSETLRKYPPVGNLVRKCTKDYTIPNTSIQIDSETRVFVPIYAIHHDPKYYPEPKKFIPERFDEEEKRKRPHYTYLPFGDGPRVCIGQRFGLMQTKLGLAMILSKFNVSVCEQTAVPMRFDARSILTTGIGGMWLKIRANK